MSGMDTKRVDVRVVARVLSALMKARTLRLRMRPERLSRHGMVLRAVAVRSRTCCISFITAELQTQFLLACAFDQGPDL
ncbi:hypothetical protein Hypma_010897 [Hypsizygus marmoreus]|uniref:Uncharacterized protein n=1 Tax=Hypsizygus marmoreus TaxID=39966 RepID=A0A369JQW5_HYPMA|nr:hypothetical protein Hypma_010897 [Hypsizygus marmoreus]